MELYSQELKCSVELQVGKDVYLEYLEGEAIFIDCWDKLPEDTREELSAIQKDLKAKLSRCVDLIQMNADLDPNRS